MGTKRVIEAAGMVAAAGASSSRGSSRRRKSPLLIMNERDVCAPFSLPPRK